MNYLIERSYTIGENLLIDIVLGNISTQLTIRLIRNQKENTGQSDNEALTKGQIIYFPEPLYSNDFSVIDNSSTEAEAASIAAAGHFLHEVMHVVQQSWIEDDPSLIAKYAYINTKYDYLGKDRYDYSDIFNGTSFLDLPLEAQADYIRDMYLLSQGYGPVHHIPGKNFDDYKLVWPADLFGPDWVKTIPSHDAKTIESMLGRVATDPIVLDLNGNGVKLTGIDDSNTYFDLHNSGFAVKTGWIESGDGFLVVDRNNNGQIDNITELFGNESVDGFTALQAMDSNGDGKINAADSGFSSLKIWQDADGDGVTDAGELTTLAERGITEIDLKATPVNTMVNGNIIGDVAFFKYANGTTGQVAEAYFDNSQMDSTYQGDYPLNPAVLLLPNARGYGTMPDLYIAMSLDSTLLNMVKELTESDLSDTATFRQQIENIIFRWADVEGVTPSSRGQYVNGQHLAAIEAMMGQEFVSTWAGITSSDPQNAHQGEAVEDAWGLMFGSIQQRLLVQGPLADLFVTFGYNYTTDSLYGTVDFSALFTSLGAATPADAAAATAVWTELVPTLISMATDLGVSRSSYQTALDAAFAAVALPEAATAIANNGVLFGDDSENDLVAPNSVASFLVGGFGSDTLRGGAGSDIIYASGGNDSIYTGSGTNIINAGGGNDTIYIQGVSDQIDAGSGNDNIFFDTANYANFGSATINGGDGDDTLTARGNISAHTITGVETLVATSEVTLTAAELASFTTLQLAGDIIAASGGVYDLSGKTLIGEASLKGSSGDDTFIAGSTTQTMRSYAGNDTLIGGSNNEQFEGGSGTNVINAGGGNDTIYIQGVSDQIDAGSGNDNIMFDTANYANFGSATINGGDGDDTLTARGNISTHTITGVETLATTGDITLTAEQLASFTTLLLAGDIVAASGGVYDLSTKTSLTEVSLKGSSGDDTLIGGSTTRTIRGYAGNDTITGGSGAEGIEGGSGTNIINAGGGNDTIYIQGVSDQIDAGSGNDNIFFDTANYSNFGAATINGGDGDDTLTAHGNISAHTITGVETLIATSEVTLTAAELASFTTLQLAGDIIAASGGVYDLSGKTLIGEASLKGSSGDDTFIAGSTTQTMRSYAGNDTLIGGSNNEQFEGGSGTNVINAGGGNDTIYIQGVSDQIDAGSGNDNIMFDTANYANFGSATINGGDGDDTLTARGNISTHTITGIETLVTTGDITLTAEQLASFTTLLLAGDIVAASGGVYDLSTKTLLAGASIKGSSETDIIIGSSNNDYLFANSGSDTLVGGSGSDTLLGGDGTDILIGGTGNDLLNGGTGNDQYQFGLGDGADTIADYDTTAGNTDVVNFGSGIGQQSLWFSQSGNNLIVNVMGTADSITVSDWYSGSAYDVEQFATNDGMKLDSQLAQLVTAMASYAANNSGFSPTSATVMPTDTALQTAIAAAWHA